MTTPDYVLGVTGTVNDTITFGKIPIGNTALRIVIEHNAGKEPLTIQPVQEPGNEFGTSDLSSAVVLDTGESLPFEVYFQPTDVGFHSAVLILESEAKRVNIVLTGEGVLSDEVNNTMGVSFNTRSYPNPFSKFTTISFTSQTGGYADVSIINTLGAEVARLYSGELAAGEHSFTWNDPAVSNGMYECLVRMNGSIQSTGIIVMR